jgi:hypothetical protein
LIHAEHPAAKAVARRHGKYKDEEAGFDPRHPCIIMIFSQKAQQKMH